MLAGLLMMAGFVVGAFRLFRPVAALSHFPFGMARILERTCSAVRLGKLSGTMWDF